MEERRRQPVKETMEQQQQQQVQRPLITTTNDTQLANNYNLKYNHHVEYLNSFPPGYRFLPTDEELIDHYLWKKVMNKPLPPNMIHDVHLYKHDPDTLSERYTPAERYPPAENAWYFFTPRDRKYTNGERPDRGTSNGYWKATGADKPIFSNGTEIGSRKALVHYVGKPPRGVKTPWIMHEYRAKNAPPPSQRGTDEAEKRKRLDDWVLCRIRKKGGKGNTDRDDNVSDNLSEMSDPSPVQSPRTNGFGFPPTMIASEQFQNPPANEVSSLTVKESQPYVCSLQLAQYPQYPPAQKMRGSQPYVLSSPLAHDHPFANKISSKKPKKSAQPYVLHSPLAQNPPTTRFRSMMLEKSQPYHVQSSLLAQNPPANELPFVMPEKSQLYGGLPRTLDPTRFPAMMPEYGQLHGLSPPIQVPTKQEILSMTPQNGSSPSSVSGTPFQSLPAALPSVRIPENSLCCDYLDCSCNNFDQDFLGSDLGHGHGHGHFMEKYKPCFNYSYLRNNSLNCQEPLDFYNRPSYVEGFDFDPVRTGAPISSMGVSCDENTYPDEVNYSDDSTTAPSPGTTK